MAQSETLKSYLVILGFNSGEELPKLKVLRLAYYKLARINHPDKNPGQSKEEIKKKVEIFKELLNAYLFVAKHIVENVADDGVDEEEMKAREEFKETNLVHYQQQVCIYQNSF